MIDTRRRFGARGDLLRARGPGVEALELCGHDKPDPAWVKELHAAVAVLVLKAELPDTE